VKAASSEVLHHLPRSADAGKTKVLNPGVAMFCGASVLEHTTSDFTEVKPLECRSWNCDSCAACRKRQLIALAAGGQPNRLLTLTIRPDIGASPTDRRGIMQAAWPKLVHQIKRHLRIKNLPSMTFIEATKRGEPHFHVLLRCGFIGQRWLSAQWEKLTGSKIVDIRAVKHLANAVRYVAKYVGKAPAQFGKFKRYYRSQDWDLRPANDDWQTDEFDWSDFERKRENGQTVIQNLVSQGYGPEPLQAGVTRFWKPGYWEPAPTGPPTRCPGGCR